MAGRPKKAVVVLGSLEECSAALRGYAVACADEQQAQAMQARAVAVASAEFEGAIDDAKRRKGELFMALQTYYYAHLAEVEAAAGGKHCDLASGRMGRRDDPPSVEPLNKGWKWESIAIKLRELWGTKYFHEPKPALPDRDRLKEGLDDDQLREVGLKRVQGETFYVEPLAPKGD